MATCKSVGLMSLQTDSGSRGEFDGFLKDTPMMSFRLFGSPGAQMTSKMTPPKHRNSKLSRQRPSIVLP